MSSYAKFTAFSIKIIFRSLTLFVLQILAIYWDMQYLIFWFNLAGAVKYKILIISYFQVMVVWDISYHIKLIAFSIKIISRPLTLLLLQISAVFGFVISTPVARFHRGGNDKVWWRHSMNCESIKTVCEGSKCSQRLSASPEKKVEWYNNMFGSYNKLNGNGVFQKRIFRGCQNKWSY